MPWKNGSQRVEVIKKAGHCLIPDIPWAASHPGWKKGFAEGGVFFWHQVGSNDPSIRKPCGCVSKLGNQKIPWKMKKNVSRKPMDLRIPPETQPCHHVHASLINPPVQVSHLAAPEEEKHQCQHSIDALAISMPTNANHAENIASYHIQPTFSWRLSKQSHRTSNCQPLLRS